MVSAIQTKGKYIIHVKASGQLQITPSKKQSVQTLRKEYDIPVDTKLSHVNSLVDPSINHSIRDPLGNARKIAPGLIISNSATTPLKAFKALPHKLQNELIDTVRKLRQEYFNRLKNVQGSSDTKSYSNPDKL